jgi:phosphatidylglycerol lysyltransferase
MSITKPEDQKTAELSQDSLEPEATDRVATISWASWRPWLIVAIGLGLAAMVVFALQQLLSEVRPDQIAAAVRETSIRDILLAILATAVSYVALMGYDISSLRYVGQRVPAKIVAMTSFIAYALGNTVGLGPLTGGAVRLRMYAAAGVETVLVAQAIAFNAVAFTLGITVIGACGLIWAAPYVAPLIHASVALLWTVAGVVLAIAIALLILCAVRREIALGSRIALRLPSLTLALQQLAVSAVDIIAAAAALWFLLPTTSMSFPGFVGFYSVAIALGVVSHVPGGLGVFEAVILLGIAGQVPSDRVAGALVLYRGIYFLLPLALAMTMLAVLELRSGVVARAAARLSPIFMAALTMIVGVMLLFSGVTPASDEAEQLLESHVPLPVVEASHFIGSVVGLALLIVAHGMLRRLDAAWWAAVGLAGLSFWLSLPKGIAVSEMAVLGFQLVMLVASRKEFDRKASLFAERFSIGWLVAIAAVICGTIWLFLFVNRDIQYANRLWWEFAFDADAPRSLRATMAVVVAAVAFSLWQLFRPPRGRGAPISAQELERAAAIVRAQPSADACLVLMGDKSLQFADSGKSFIMYGKRGRSWVALFDPVGPQEEWHELVWEFIEMADSHGGRAAFYQVRPQTLSIYLDAGLKIFKLGEDAYVPLPVFDLKGKRRANLRTAVNRAEREGLRFEMIAAEGVQGVLPQLRTISDAWLAGHKAREKGFSLGSFDAEYLYRLPVAIVRRGDTPVAFAVLLSTDAKLEVRVDLMRQIDAAPPGTMEFLFTKLMLEYRERGFARFGLGMAPMSGMVEHPLAPRWHRFGRMLFAYGENFYNFQGLRAFKEKFDPVWEARYLATEGGLSPLFVLTEVAALISGGLRGVIGK